MKAGYKSVGVQAISSEFPLLHKAYCENRLKLKQKFVLNVYRHHVIFCFSFDTRTVSIFFLSFWGASVGSPMAQDCQVYLSFLGS